MTELKNQMIAKLQERVYLGDGVYAHHDGYQVWLTTLEDNRIALDDDVLNAMGVYIVTVKKLIEAILVEASKD